MNTLIIISVLPIVLLYLGLYKAGKALLPINGGRAVNSFGLCGNAVE